MTKTAILAVFIFLRFMLSSQTQFRHLKMQVQRKLVESLHLAESYFKREFSMPTINYDLRGVKAGVAYLQKTKSNLTALYCLKIHRNLFIKLFPMNWRI
ncbi:SprT family metallopeptidase [Rodentibacter pneumotropicus]|uniref:SprT family metallopeptidase n=1 Tax=Rodentibacter pneumotropicus TaxID=758 RepID=A0A448MMK5_9PAST|nr:SprT family metallopeptidase [Rodentibacter pneumotropicus]